MFLTKQQYSYLPFFAHRVYLRATPASPTRLIAAKTHPATAVAHFGRKRTPLTELHPTITEPK